MISYIRGELVALEEDKVIVDVGGVGYGIFMSGQAMGQLPPVGSKVKIHTYLNVKEDVMQLYGFLNRDALSVFKLLILSLIHIYSDHAWGDRHYHLRDLGDIYRTFRRSTGCVDRSFRIRNAGHCCCRTEYLHPSDHQAGRKRRVGVEVVWH